MSKTVQIEKMFPIDTIVGIKKGNISSNYNDISKLVSARVEKLIYPYFGNGILLKLRIIEGEVFHEIVEYESSATRLDSIGNKRNWRFSGRDRRSYKGEIVHIYAKACKVIDGYNPNGIYEIY